MTKTDASDDYIDVLSLDARLVAESANVRKALAIMDFASVEGADWLAFWNGDDRRAAQTAVDAARAGARGRFTGILAVEGRERWWDVAVTPIVDADGRPERLLAISRDVSRLPTSHRARERSEERLLLTAAAHPGILWSATPDGRIEHFDGAELAVRPPLEIHLGDGWIETVHPDDRASAVENWRIARQRGGSYDAQFRVLMKDGTYRSHLVRGLPQCDEHGTVVRWVGVSVDVEDRQRAYERERNIAATLQEASLSRTLPTVDDLSLSVDYRPGSDEATIGGDWYDAFVLKDGRVAFTIGDVLGSGLKAAVTMGKVRQAMRAVALVLPEPNTMLDVADATIREESDDLYATALAGIYDGRDHSFVFASAGHPGPIVRSPEGRVTEFRAPGLLLGLREAYANDTVTAACPPGSQIVFFTDGLSEATRDIDEGLRRIRAAIADADVARADRPATALVEHVLRGSPATDDIAVLVAAIGPSARVASDAAERGAEALIAGVR